MIVNSISFQNNIKTPTSNIRVSINRKNYDSISFSGEKISFLSKILSSFKSKKPKTPGEVQDVCENKLVQLAKNNNQKFIIFSPEGKILHQQSGYNISKKGNQQIKNNVLVIRQLAPLKITDLFDFFLRGAKKIHFNSIFDEHADKNMTQKIITFPELTPEKTEMVNHMEDNIIGATNELMERLVEHTVLTTQKMVVINDTAPLLKTLQSGVEAKVFDKYIDELGIKIEEKPLPAQK